MTPAELKYNTQETLPHFFTRKTMKFFGDTMANYGVRSTTIDTYTRQDIEVWELYRKKPVKHGLWNSAYFGKTTFERVFEKN